MLARATGAGRPPQTARGARFNRRAVAVGLAAVVLLAAGFGRFHGIDGWDDTYYLGQLSSLVHDGDLDLRNDALHSEIAPGEVVRLLSTLLPDGSLANTFSIGPALLWAPAYLAATPPRLAARWTAAQLAAIHLLSLAFCLYLVWAMARLGRRYGASRRDALLIGAGLLAASPLLVYGFRVYTMSHLPGTVAACWFLASLIALLRTPRPLPAALAGASLGCLTIVRWQDALFAVLAVPVAGELARRIGWRRLGALALCGAAGFLPLALVQSHAWWLERGVFAAVPQGAAYLDLAGAQLRSFLLSGRSGFLPWMPLAVVAIAGFCLPWRLRLPSSWRWSCLALVIAQVAVSASVEDWWGGYSYGARRMTSLVPVLAIGLANASRAGRSGWLRAAVAAACLWGFFTAGLYSRRVQDLAPVFLGRVSAHTGAAQAAGLVTESGEARRIARKWPLRGSTPRYFPGHRAGRALALAVIAAWLALVSWSLLARPRAERSLAAVLGLYFALALAAHLRLATGSRPDAEERRAWARFTAGEPVTAPPSGHPAGDAYRFLLARRALAAGDPTAATELCELSARDYDAARRVLEEHPEVRCSGAGWTQSRNR